MKTAAEEDSSSQKASKNAVTPRARKEAAKTTVIHGAGEEQKREGVVNEEYEAVFTTEEQIRKNLRSPEGSRTGEEVGTIKQNIGSYHKDACFCFDFRIDENRTRSVNKPEVELPSQLQSNMSQYNTKITKIT